MLNSSKFLCFLLIILSCLLTVSCSEGNDALTESGSVAANASSNELVIGGAFGSLIDDNIQAAVPSQQTVVYENHSQGNASHDGFGITERAALGPLGLPIDGVQLGDYELVNAYPNLTFQEALLVDDVPGENRMIVVEQRGNIKVFNDDPAVATSAVILDYSDNIATSSGEQGLLGFAFDPEFTENRFVYIYHTQVVTNASIVTRLPWDRATDTLDASKAKIILRVEQPFETHNAGMIAFGSDEYLYIALGDGGDGGDPFNHAQNKSNLLGSLLRIDVHPADDAVGYLVPDSNPFVGQAGVRGEIYANGFRNPFRFSFDRETGDIWLGDVGQETFEEINKVEAGGNYGWRVYEGTRLNETKGSELPLATFIPPIHEYTHDKGLAVIGGYVYRGAVGSLQGRYLFSDFANGEIRALSLDGDRVTSVDVIGSVVGPTSFGETRDGEVLVVSRYDGVFKFVENSSTIEFPEMLSETGVFSDLDSLTPTSGLIEYEPSHPFWTDGAEKRRWIGLPEGVTIDFTADDWTFPLGTIAVKHFEMQMIEDTPGSARRLETRVLYNTAQGWQGRSYRWNAEQTEAIKLLDGQTEQLSIAMNDGSVREQQYDYPSQADCKTCHVEASTYLLGLETAQLNTSFAYAAMSDNQLRSFNNIGMFSYDIGSHAQYEVLPALDDESASIESRARAYLDVNCSACHQPRGMAPTSMDFRIEADSDSLKAIDVWPQAGSFDISDPRIIAAGSKERSVLWHRMQSLDTGRMPPISTHVVDKAGVRLIGEWIDSLTP